MVCGSGAASSQDVRTCHRFEVNDARDSETMEPSALEEGEKNGVQLQRRAMLLECLALQWHTF